MAEFHGVSPSYLLKHLQALSRAGIVETIPGPRGGYRLNRPPDAITLLDIVLAAEGPEPAFRCKEIRQKGPDPLPTGHFQRPCLINAAMLRAEQAYRLELRGTTIAILITELAAEGDIEIESRCQQFFDASVRKTPSAQPKGNSDDPET